MHAYARRISMHRNSTEQQPSISSTPQSKEHHALSERPLCRRPGCGLRHPRAKVRSAQMIWKATVSGKGAWLQHRRPATQLVVGCRCGVRWIPLKHTTLTKYVRSYVAYPYVVCIDDTGPSRTNLPRNVPYYNQFSEPQPENGHGSAMANQKQIRRGVERPERNHGEGFPGHWWQRRQHCDLRCNHSPWCLLAGPIRAGKSGRSEVQKYVLAICMNLGRERGITGRDAIPDSDSIYTPDKEHDLWGKD